ncbi:hypothetical protein AB0K35_11485 [Micromonospora sp. NPDC053740]|uniref:hypothetical protein n=1 Tax=Micromonospora sp. NPDC053740 TaxID=3155173 RepID=UPI003420A8D1
MLIVAAGLTVAPMLGRFLMGGVPFVLVIMPVVPVAGVWLARRLTRSGGELSAPGHRFRLQPADGRTVRVVIDGEIDPDSLRPGDVARVHSAGSREGHIVARSVDILATLGGPVVRQVAGRTPGPIVAARLLNAISIALAVLLVASAAAVIVG